MANKIQIKRTTVTGRTPNTTDPANTRYIDAGELSLNLTDGKLFSSNGSVYFEVGGNLQSLSVTSGLTANSTRVNSAVNTAIAAIIANGSIGTSGQVLTSNSTGIYWSTVSGGGTPGGSDTQVQFNDGGSTLGGSAGFTFNKTTNNVTIGNTVTLGTTATVNGSLANLQALNVVNQTNTGTLYVTTSANVGTAFTANSTLVNAVALNVVNQTNTATLYVTTSANVASAFLANSTGAYHTGTINAASYTVGAAFTANSTLVNAVALNVVNQTNTDTLFVTTSANVGTAAVINSVGITHTGFANVTGAVNAASHTVGTSLIANSVGITHTGFANVATSVNSALLSVGTSAIINTVGITHTGFANIEGNANVGGTFGVTGAANALSTLGVNGLLFAAGNANIAGQVNTATLFVTTSANVGTSLTVNSTAINAAVNTSIGAIIANGSIGTAGQALLSNATGIYWGTIVTSYSANVGNGSATSITVTHNLNDANVFASVRENSSGYYVYPDIKYSTVNDLILEFVDAPTTDQYKVIVIGA